MVIVLWLASPLNGVERASLYVNLGRSYYQVGHYEKAVDYYNLGVACAEMGMHEKTRDEYENAIATSERKSSTP
jgi:tetratricopeptide (TPR) repeat protein